MHIRLHILLHTLQRMSLCVYAQAPAYASANTNKNMQTANCGINVQLRQLDTNSQQTSANTPSSKKDEERQQVAKKMSSNATDSGRGFVL